MRREGVLLGDIFRSLFGDCFLVRGNDLVVYVKSKVL